MIGAALALLLGSAALVGGRRTRRTGDVRRATCPVRPVWNAAAISGEYVSAAAFLGTAGLVLAYGPETLWLAAGATAGYVLLLAFVAGPLRRSGSFTVADFAEWRLGSRPVRRIVSGCVCCVGWFYLLPQFQGAGMTLRVLTGAPEWAGWALVAAASFVLVLTGALRGVTAAQAVQFWVKLAALAVPAVALATLLLLPVADGGVPVRPAAPRFERATAVTVRSAAGVRVAEDVAVRATGVVDGRAVADAPVRLTAGVHAVAAGARLVFPAGAAVPRPERPADTGFAAPGDGHGLFAVYSALLGVLLGTVGLPHILMRLYTAGGGRAARRAATLVPALLAVFSLFPALYGVLGRVYTPELLLSGDTDATILMLPGRLVPGPLGAALTGCVAAGACAAFLSTSCAVVAAIAGLAARIAPARGALAFRTGAALALAVPLAVVPALLAGDPAADGAHGFAHGFSHGFSHGAAGLVTIALTVSACSLGPLLLLGIWWRGLTPAGAAAGLLTGGGTAVAAGAASLSGAAGTGAFGAVVEQPALVLAPLATGVMVAVSLLGRRSVPAHADLAMARLHLPDEPDAR
ncbi:sodium:solute symporter family transporter [Actinomadura atramentaria]|uniref:sodium:solute symporter family transporter n=1 Tax=Actinomadura atramentaria TaxID=1990 RepID=UPI000380C4D5|nr:hypothetical protein [Actinomadura atramentaria]